VYHQNYDPFGNVFLSTLVAALPILALLYFIALHPHRDKQGVKHLDASWHLEHAIESGEEVVIEWTMLWRDPRHDNVQRIDRGTEWFIVRDGLIAEVRAYHHSDAKNRAGDLLGFDHEGRDYTMLEQWDEVRERDGAGPDAEDRVRA